MVLVTLTPHVAANNQWELGMDMSDDPRKSSFFKAMQLTEGSATVGDPVRLTLVAAGILLVLDSAGTPFSRIWW